MKIIKNKEKENFLTIVCCLHGDEIFGLKVFGYFKNNIADYPGMKIILANELAIEANKRFVETDLNRSFPGGESSYEERLASDILAEVKHSQYVLDIHTTTSQVKFVPIISQLNNKTKKIINLCSSKEVALMSEIFSKKSLIGQIDGGVSLEFNFDYAKDASALMEIEYIVKNIFINKKNKAKDRKIFFIDKKITKSVDLPKESKNFELINELGIYPFLLYEKSYQNIYGFFANDVRSEKI